MSKLNIVCGDIFNYLDGKDLIVNSANKFMSVGCGVCGTIYKNAGRGLLEYCYSNYNKYMEINEIRFTPGFNLGVDILHIYCPKYYESKRALEELLESYNNIFIEAVKKGYKNIVSVSLGTGAHGYNHNDIAMAVVGKLKKLVEEYDIDLTLVLPSWEIWEIYNI